MDHFTWQFNSGNIPLLLEVQSNFIPVSGISPTVEVKRSSDEYFADWSSNTFKAPGSSGLRYGLMTEVDGSAGVYKRLFNPYLFSETTPKSYIVTYRALLPSGLIVGSTTISEDTNLFETDVHSFIDFVGSGVLAQQGMTITFV